MICVYSLLRRCEEDTTAVQYDIGHLSRDLEYLKFTLSFWDCDIRIFFEKYFMVVEYILIYLRCVYSILTRYEESITAVQYDIGHFRHDLEYHTLYFRHQNFI